MERGGRSPAMQLNPIGPQRKERKHAWSGLYPLTLENNKTKQGTT
jgi:hypothetical protein